MIVSTKQLIVAICLIIVGIAKVIIAALQLSMKDPNQYGKVPFSKYLFSPDHSAAGKNIDAIILLVGFYTFLHGMVMIYCAPKIVIDLFMIPITHIIINVAIGLYCLIFFGLVLYTSVNISKNVNNMDSYRLFGFASGFLFLATAPLAVIMHRYIDLDLPFFSWTHFPYFIICGVFLSLFLYEVLRRNVNTNASKVSDVALMSVINGLAFTFNGI